MFGRLEGSFEAEQQFTADASHELRTPVAVIKSACEYAEKYGGDPPGAAGDPGHDPPCQADRMTQLIQQLLSITRLEQGTEPAQREALDLAALVTRGCAPTSPTPRTGCLIDNGFAYGKPQGHVWVTLGDGRGPGGPPGPG